MSYLDGKKILSGANLPEWHKPAPRAPRVDRKKQCREIAAKTRADTISEAISLLRREMRGKPVQWHRGYFSAISTLESMNDPCRPSAPDQI